jgi:hypothetical protein
MLVKKSDQTCFFIMPFGPVLHYFYLYLKHHIETNYPFQVIRADEKVLTKPMLDKITDMIKEAEVIIADCSGLRPNVLYELGIAHALNKKVILLSHSEPEQAPSDIRHFEFIFYKLDNHTEFLAKLDNAMHNVFFERYAPLYEKAREIFDEFRNTTGLTVNVASKDIFTSRVMLAEKKREIPELTDSPAVARFVLPKIIETTDDVQIMEQIPQWLAKTFGIGDAE